MLRKFSWIQVPKYFIALWLIAHGTMVLGFLNNVDAAEIFRLSKDEQEKLTAISISKLTVSISLAYTIGEIIGFVICLLGSRQTRDYINAIIASILLVILGLTIGTGWEILKLIFLLPGKLFSGALYYLINGVLMIIAGTALALWHSRKSGDFQSRSQYKPHSA